MNNTKDHASREQHQAKRDDPHDDQRNRDDLFKEKGVLWHVRFAFHIRLICHVNLSNFLINYIVIFRIVFSLNRN